MSEYSLYKIPYGLYCLITYTFIFIVYTLPLILYFSYFLELKDLYYIAFGVIYYIFIFTPLGQDIIGIVGNNLFKIFLTDFGRKVHKAEADRKGIYNNF